MQKRDTEKETLKICTIDNLSSDSLYIPLKKIGEKYDIICVYTE